MSQDPALRLPPPRRLTRLRRWVLLRRRVLAAVLVGVAALAALQVLQPPAPATEQVLVAARDLPSGTTVGSGDVHLVSRPADSLPDDLITDPVGRTLAAPAAAGEPIVRLRLLGAPPLTTSSDVVAMPLRLPDSGMAALLQVGDRIDLVASDPREASAEVIAEDVTVLATPGDDTATAGVSGAPAGRLVILGVAKITVPEVALSAAQDFLTFAYAQ